MNDLQAFALGIEQLKEDRFFVKKEMKLQSTIIINLKKWI